MAAKKLPIPEVPVMVPTGWTDAQKIAYPIADNKLTLQRRPEADVTVEEAAPPVRLRAVCADRTLTDDKAGPVA